MSSQRESHVLLKTPPSRHPQCLSILYSNNHLLHFNAKDCFWEFPHHQLVRCVRGGQWRRGGGVGGGSVCSIRLALPVQREARNPTSCLDYLVLLADQAN